MTLDDRLSCSGCAEGPRSLSQPRWDPSPPVADQLVDSRGPFQPLALDNAAAKDRSDEEQQSFHSQQVRRNLGHNTVVRRPTARKKALAVRNPGFSIVYLNGL
jgi:hypothetical protein